MILCILVFTFKKATFKCFKYQRYGTEQKPMEEKQLISALNASYLATFISFRLAITLVHR